MSAEGSGDAARANAASAPTDDAVTRASAPKRADGAPQIGEVFTYLIVRDAARALEFYAAVFGAEILLRLDDGARVGHAELRFGPAVIMVADEYPELGIVGPATVGGTGTRIHLHVDDVDRLTSRAAAAGATVLRGPRDEAHGERQSRIRDPFGHEWLVGDGG